MSRPGITHIHYQVLLALDVAGDAQDLSQLREMLTGSHRVADLLPVVGSLVTSGYVQKVAAASSANAPLRSRRGPSGPVHFQLTEQGRQELRSSPWSTRLAMTQLRRATKSTYLTGASAADDPE